MQNQRLKTHVLLFIDKLDTFIKKAHILKEEKRKRKDEPQNEILVMKQRELDSTLAKIQNYRKRIVVLK
jgi:hypothetical protein